MKCKVTDARLEGSSHTREAQSRVLTQAVGGATVASFAGEGTTDWSLRKRGRIGQRKY